MTTRLRTARFAAAASCTLALVACDGQAPEPGSAPPATTKATGPAADPNKALVERVRQALAADTEIPDDLDVSASGGVVSLWGRVNNEKERRRAEEIARSVGGVQRVENKLTIKTD